MTIRLFSLVLVLGTAGAFSACAQVQQPTATQPRVASKKVQFFSSEILGAKYKSDHILLEHPSNPASMQRTQRVSPIVQVAGGDDIPTQHLFDDSTKARQRPFAEKDEVPSPPGSADESITPITEDSATRLNEEKLDPIPEPSGSTEAATVEPVVIAEPVVVSNVEGSTTLTGNATDTQKSACQSAAAFKAGSNGSYVNAVSTSMEPGCSN